MQTVTRSFCKINEGNPMKKSPRPKISYPRPPAGLGRAGKALWRRVVAEYDLDDAALLGLSKACAEADREAEAEGGVGEQGLTYSDRFGQVKARPEVVIARDSRTGLLRWLKWLRLDQEPLQARPGRPAGGKR